MAARTSLAPALLCVAVIAFASAQRHLLPAHPPAAARATWTVLGFALAAAALGVAGYAARTMLRAIGDAVVRRRRGRDTPPLVSQNVATRRARATALLLAAVVVLTPVLALTVVPHVTGSGAGASHGTASTAESAAARPSRRVQGGSGTHTNVWTLYAVGGAMVASVVLGLALTSRRPAAPGLGQSVSEAALQDVTKESVRSGAEAMVGVDDVRRGIIGCYAAMQASLERAGLGRSPVRTPSELLAEASRRDLVASEPASVLTALFERARFSSDRLIADDREAALRALASVRTREVGR